MELLKRELRLIDHSNVTNLFGQTFHPLHSFALDDAIATMVGKGDAPATIRLWVHDPSLILGIPDTRLERLDAGVSQLRSLGYELVVRNSGGLAVLLDRQVLNVSIILPNKPALSIDQAYALMYRFTQALFRAETDKILAYEIEGSYCPGSYDLSIDGKKFAGLSQRRVRNGVAIQMYLDLAGDSQKRASLVKQFYDLAKGEGEAKFNYPDIQPQVMASLSQLLNTELTVEAVVARIEALLQGLTTKPLARELSQAEEVAFEQRLPQMHKRNEVIQA